MTELEVRSYRAVFALERRIYQIDTLRLNPAGIPLRGLAYAASLVLAALLAHVLPGVSLLASAIPWYLADIAAPLALGALLAMLRIEGRPFHLAALSLVRHRGAPSRFVGLRRLVYQIHLWHPPAVAFIHDGSEARPRSARYYGPGVVLVGFAHERVEWSRGLTPWRRADVTLHPVRGTPPVAPVALELSAGAMLEIGHRRGN
ncbi:MAG: hypothetical protein ABSC56_10150 [Solirubrobacteraceae bacterium]|jgi:hypothetical protein